MHKIVVVGSLNVDLVGVASRIPSPGETVIGRDFFQVAGGKGANQAYAASMLGGSVAMLGRVGNDDYGPFLLAGLRDAGCDVAHVRTVEGPSGIALIMVSEAGQNSILVAPGSNSKYELAEFEADAEALTGAALVLLQLETPLETVTAAALAARRAGARVILDPAPVPDALPENLFRSVDILTPNEVEAAQLAGGRAQELSLDDAQAIARRLLAKGVGAAIIKLGPRGCLLAEGDAVSNIPAPIVNAVDTTAAGDVFNGALAVSLTEGASLEEACRFAVRAAALSVTRTGAQSSMPRRSDVG